MRSELDRQTSRRTALKLGGLSAGLAALVAACGEDRGGDDAPGRVGDVPVPTPLPEYEVDDVVLLRTASSLEYTAIAAYEAALGLDGVVPEAVVPTFERLIENHRGVAEEMEQLTSEAGGEPWTCTNPWLMERLIDPTFALIQSNVVGVVIEDADGNPTMVQVMAEEVPISDTVTTVEGDITLVSTPDDLSAGDELEFTRLPDAIPEDVMAFANALESLAAASHQELTSATTILDARIAHIEAATLEARHAALLAVELYGPDGYISPALLGEDVPPTTRGQIRHFAVEASFGQTAQIEIKAGPGDINNVRESVILQTPAANSFVYNELSCDA